MSILSRRDDDGFGEFLANNYMRNDLRERFGYEPKSGDQWCTYQGNLIVISADRKPIMIQPGGAVHELEPASVTRP